MRTRAPSQHGSRYHRACRSTTGRYNAKYKRVRERWFARRADGSVEPWAAPPASALAIHRFPCRGTSRSAAITHVCHRRLIWQSDLLGHLDDNAPLRETTAFALRIRSLVRPIAAKSRSDAGRGISGCGGFPTARNVASQRRSQRRNARAWGFRSQDASRLRLSPVSGGRNRHTFTWQTLQFEATTVSRLSTRCRRRHKQRRFSGRAARWHTSWRRTMRVMYKFQVGSYLRSLEAAPRTIEDRAIRQVLLNASAGRAVCSVGTSGSETPKRLRRADHSRKRELGLLSETHRNGGGVGGPVNGVLRLQMGNRPGLDPARDAILGAGTNYLLQSRPNQPQRNRQRDLQRATSAIGNPFLADQAAEDRETDANMDPFLPELTQSRATLQKNRNAEQSGINFELRSWASSGRGPE